MIQESIEPPVAAVHHFRRVLIVARDDALRAQVRALMERERHTVYEAAGSDGIDDLIASSTPHLVVLADDDFDTCRRLDGLADFSRAPVLMLLSRDDDALITAAYAAGAADVVILPLRPVILTRRAELLLKVSEMRSNLTESEERYRIISTMISDYAYAYKVTGDGRLVKEWSTHAFETITGYHPTELDGEGWSSLIHPDDIQAAVARMYRLLAGEYDATEFRIITKDGHVRWLLDHGQPVWDADKQRVTHIFGAAQDITEHKQALEQLREQAAVLQERNKELDAFAHTVAHDLKNPISSMMGFASLVLTYYDRMTDDRIKENLQLIMESGYKLKQIINSILLLAGVTRMESVQIQPLDMGDIVYNAQSRLHNMIEETQAEISMPLRFPAALGYAPWVEEVWANYLSNALKYGGTPPRIAIGAETLRGGQVRFWVEDNGHGLSADDMARVFMPFTRMTQAKIEGHGLGLSVVQRIVERLGGQVGVDSETGRGSRFSFTLPAARR